MSTFDRLSFLKGAAVATGTVVVSGVPTAMAAEQSAEVVGQPTALPREPLLAYVRDLDRGEVTVVAGLHETTFRDPQLAKRIHKAAARGAERHDRAAKRWWPKSWARNQASGRAARHWGVA
jgi:hypothetical protein